MAVTGAEIQAKFTSVGADGVEGDMDRLGGKTSALGEKFIGAGKKATAFATVPILGFFGGAILGASNLNEEISKNQTIFGDSAGAILDWSKTSNTSLGMSRSAALQATGTYGAMFDAMGFGTDQAANMSKEFVQLSSDFASFNNISQERANEAFQAALTGEYESLKRYGIVLNEATVEAKALEMGLGDVNGELSTQDKVLARQALIMEQTATAQGDFARTSDSLANQMRIFKATVADVAANIGTMLLPMAQAAMGALNGWLQSLRGMSPELQKWIVGIAAAAAAIGPLLIGIGMAIKSFQTIKAAMTGLKIAALLTNPIGLAIVAIAALATGFVLAYKHIEPFRKLVDTVGDALRDFFRNTVDRIEDFTDGFREAWRALTSGEQAINRVSAFFRSLASGIAAFFTYDIPGWALPVVQAFNGIAEITDELVTAFDRWRAQGLNPVSAALAALGDVFPSITEMMWDAVGVVENLVAAFREFTAGNWIAGFDDLREAGQQALNVFRGMGDAIVAGLAQLGPALLSAAQSAWDGVVAFFQNIALPIASVVISIAGWVAGTIADVWAWLRDTALPAVGAGLVALPGVVVDVAGWAAGAIADVWSWLTGYVLGGSQGDGTGGPLAGSVGGVKLGEVFANVASWAAGVIADVWSWLEDTAIPAMGEALVGLGSVTVDIASWIPGAITNVWTWLRDYVIGGGSSGITGGSNQAAVIGAGGGLDLGEVLVNIAQWAAGAVADFAGWLKGKIVTWLGGFSITSTDLITVGTKVVSAIRDAITTAVQAAVDMSSTFLTWITGQIEGVDWNSVGSKFAELLVAGIKGVILLAGMAGYILGQILLALVDVNWSAVGTSFKDFFVAAVKAVVGFLTGFGTTLFNEIKTEIEGIDWSAIGTAIKDGLVGAVAGVGTAIGNAIADELPGWARQFLGLEGGVEMNKLPPGASGSGAITTDWSGRDLLSSRGGLGKFSSDAFGGSTSITIPAPDFSAVITAVQTALQTITTAVTTHSAAWPVIIGSNAAAMAASASSAGAAMLAAMQASLQTVTVAVTTQTSAWATIIAANGAAMGASATSAGQAIVTALQAALQTATVAVTTQSRAWVTILTANGSAAQSATTSAFTAVRSSVQSNMQAAQSAATSAANSLRSGVSSAFSATQSSVVSSVTSLRSGVTSAMQSTSSAAIAAANSMRAGVTSAMATMASAAAAAVRNGMSQIPGIISSVGASAAATARAVGANIGNAMAAGMSSALGAIRSAANAMVAEAQRALTARAQIASPSKLFLSLGELVGEGFELGIRRMIPDVARATGDLVGVPALAGPYGGAVPYGAVGGGYVDRRTISITIGDIIQQPGEDGEALARRIGDATLERLHTALVSTGRR